MNITTEQPIGFLILCVLLGLAFSLILYLRQLRNVEKGRSVWPIRILALLRFFSITLLAILLLNPLLRYLQRSIEKPAVILAIDNSRSMQMGQDSIAISKEFKDFETTIREKLSSKFEVITVLAGESVKPGISPTFTDEITDLSSVFKEQDLVYTGGNLAAQIMVSDGITNRGANPVFMKEALATPLYTVGFGDTSIHKDVRIYEAKANAITFLGNTFPIEMVVNADKCEGTNIDLGLYMDGQKLSAVSLPVQGERYSVKHTFITKANRVGAHQYEVKASGVAGELHLENNRKYVYTEVLDGRQKIALVANGPHPDLGAIRAMIQSNDQYEVSLFVNELPNIKAKDFDLVITHQLPKSNADLNFLQQLKTQGIPQLNILGTQTEVALFNKLNTGISINGNRRNYNQSLPALETAFGLFELSESYNSFLTALPPLISPFGDYNTISKQGTLLKQRIGQVTTEMPMLYFNDVNGYRNGVLTGEGIWRWRMYDYEIHQHFDHANELLSRTIQYLSVKSDKRKFRLYTSSKQYNENEVVSFFADVYNDSYEATMDADVRLQLKDESGKDYTYALSPSDGMYRLRLGVLPPGLYNYTGNAKFNGKSETATGSFLVRALELEKTNITADFGWMRSLSEQSGGQFYTWNGANVLADSILARTDATALSTSSFTIKDVIDQKWIFFLIVLLLGTEWFVRRWTGGY